MANAQSVPAAASPVQSAATTKSIPTLIKVISILYYIGAAFEILFGILLLVGAGMAGPLLSQIPLLGALGAGLFIIGAIVLIGLGVLSIFIGMGLWKGKQWARIVAIVFAAIGILTAVLSMLSGNIMSNIFSLALNGAVGAYLLLNADVKQAFS